MPINIKCTGNPRLRSNKYVSLHKVVNSMNIPVRPKTLNKTFSYNSGCAVVIIRLLFNPHDVLWLWQRGKSFVIVVYFKMAERQSRESFCTSSRGSHIRNSIRYFSRKHSSYLIHNAYCSRSMSAFINILIILPNFLCRYIVCWLKPEGIIYAFLLHIMRGRTIAANVDHGSPYTAFNRYLWPLFYNQPLMITEWEVHIITLRWLTLPWETKICLSLLTS